jgi:Pyruvate/2-oxoacid:ferredoxin oxidoreductase delta subunit
MGLAIIDPEICLPFLGVSCKACWHACPFPEQAIRFDQRGRPVVIPDGCVGCGLCEFACLAEHPAIVVQP